jgi:hypothetical protein
LTEPRRWWVERNETWWVTAESEEDALAVIRDGGGEGYTLEWFAEEAMLVLASEEPRGA